MLEPGTWSSVTFLQGDGLKQLKWFHIGVVVQPQMDTSHWAPVFAQASISLVQWWEFLCTNEIKSLIIQ